MQDFENIRAKAKALYEFRKEIHCPYFQTKIILNSDGFNHLQYKPNRTPRNLKEQILKFILLKKALEIIPKCGTLQEHRMQIEKYGKMQNDGFYKMKQVQYWGFHAILNNKKHKIKIILKQVGDGNIMFWSVMPYDQRLYTQGIDED
ncbi:MAG: hypothetical protein V4439_03760 [Patescibacteria group bacterium]